MAFTLFSCTHDEPAIIDMANPASVYCIEHGGELELRKGSIGHCHLSYGSVIEEWEIYRQYH